MKRSLLSHLECPLCHQPFGLEVKSEEGEEIMEGDLACACRHYPIIRGVPRLLPGTSDVKNVTTAERFGVEWKQFSELSDKYEDQFLSWIEPVGREHFVGKLVLDVGCGKGRHVWCSNKFGAREVIGVDLSQAVDAAFENVGRLPNVHIIQADVYSLPLKPEFDYAYSIGVLHHTPNPAKSFQCMVDKVRSGGSVSAWVYGREGNGWIIYILNPIRRVTSMLPLPITKALSFILAAIMQAGLKIFYWPAEHFDRLKWLKKILPYSAYLCSIADFPFKENYLIVYDHLLPEIAFYVKKEEITDWFAAGKLGDAVITQRYGNSWRGFGVKPL
ncbi:MAG: methyltransferase domain-containing protein [Patescibacteria group bacterium]|nr:methyltransferase domain-containing protein [Patescibacteria group bacterium]